MFSFKFAVGIVLAAVSAASFVGIQHLAQQAKQAEDVAKLSSYRQLLVNSDGTYPAALVDSVDSGICSQDLRDVMDGVCKDLTKVPAGATISYVTNTERTHYVIAERESDDSVAMTSDTASAPALCPAYNATCIAAVTTDAQIRQVAPVWVKF